MRSKFDLRHNLAKLKPETADDLVVLQNVITPGSFAKSKTLRSVEVRRGDEKIKAGKRSVILKISVEKAEFHETTGKLRLMGKIIEAPEGIEKAYHTIEIGPFSFLEVEKEWKKWEIDKIKGAETKAERVLVCVLDETEADLWEIKERKRHLVHLTCSLGKASGVSTKPKFYSDIFNMLKEKQTNHIVIAGPAFAKEELNKYIKEKDRELSKKIILDSLMQTGETGLQELLRKGVLERVLKISRISEETKIVELLLEEIAKDGKAVYGIEETKKALEVGAIETLIISDKKIREFEDLVEIAEKMKSKVMIISSDHEAGEKLFRLGGIAGLLRYKIS